MAGGTLPGTDADDDAESDRVVFHVDMDCFNVLRAPATPRAGGRADRRCRAISTVRAVDIGRRRPPC